MGRLAQWESACLTRKRSLVQTQCRPPMAAPSSSGLGRSPLKAEIAGSNPAGATNSISASPAAEFRTAAARRAESCPAIRTAAARRAESPGGY